MDITITPAAQKFMRRMVRFGGDGATGFRLLVSPGGCSGLASEFTVEPAAPALDDVGEVEGALDGLVGGAHLDHLGLVGGRRRRCQEDP